MKHINMITPVKADSTPREQSSFKLHQMETILYNNKIWGVWGLLDTWKSTYQEALFNVQIIKSLSEIVNHQVETKTERHNCDKKFTVQFRLYDRESGVDKNGGDESFLTS